MSDITSSVPDFHGHQASVHNQSDGAYERLRHTGNLGLQLTLPTYQTLTFPVAGQYAPSLVVGPLDGVQRATLIYNAVPQSAGHGFINDEGNFETMALYMYNFYRRHTSPFKRQFIMPHPMTGVDMLWEFESEPQMTLSQSFIWQTQFNVVSYPGPANAFVSSHNNGDVI